MANTFQNILDGVLGALQAIDPPLPTVEIRKYPVLREGDRQDVPLILVCPQTEDNNNFSGEPDESEVNVYPVLVAIFQPSNNNVKETGTTLELRVTIKEQLHSLWRMKTFVTFDDPDAELDEVNYRPRVNFNSQTNPQGMDVSYQLFEYRVIESE